MVTVSCFQHQFRKPQHTHVTRQINRCRCRPNHFCLWTDWFKEIFWCSDPNGQQSDKCHVKVSLIIWLTIMTSRSMLKCDLFLNQCNELTGQDVLGNEHNFSWKLAKSQTKWATINHCAINRNSSACHHSWSTAIHSAHLSCTAISGAWQVYPGSSSRCIRSCQCAWFAWMWSHSRV